MNDDGHISEMQNVIPLRVDFRDGEPVEMTPDRVLRIKMRMAELKMDQAGLSDATGLSNSAISQILNLKIKKTRHLPKFAKALGVNMSWLRGETDQRIDLTNWKGAAVSEDSLPELLGDKEFAKANVDTIRTEGILANQFERKWDAVAIPEIDMSQSSGIHMKGIPIKTNGHVFSREILRTFTSADSSAVMLAQGIGDAMQPLLNDGDVVFLDTSHRSLDCLDAVWMMRYAGMMAVRRARKTPEGVRLMADNPSLPDIMTAEGEVEFFGKVVGTIRKI